VSLRLALVSGGAGNSTGKPIACFSELSDGFRVALRSIDGEEQPDPEDTDVEEVEVAERALEEIESRKSRKDLSINILCLKPSKRLGILGFLVSVGE